MDRQSHRVRSVLMTQAARGTLVPSEGSQQDLPSARRRLCARPKRSSPQTGPAAESGGLNGHDRRLPGGRLRFSGMPPPASGHPVTSVSSSSQKPLARPVLFGSEGSRQHPPGTLRTVCVLPKKPRATPLPDAALGHPCRCVSRSHLATQRGDFGSPKNVGVPHSAKGREKSVLTREIEPRLALA